MCLRGFLRTPFSTIAPQRVPIERANKVELARRRHEDHDQDISFGARPFILCGLPNRKQPPETRNYSRRNGHFFLEIVGHPDYGDFPVRTRQAGAPLARNGSGPTTVAGRAIWQRGERSCVEWGICPPTALITGGCKMAFGGSLPVQFSSARKTSFGNRKLWDCSHRTLFRPDAVVVPKARIPNPGKSRRTQGHPRTGILGGFEEPPDTGGHRSGAPCWLTIQGLPRPVHWLTWTLLQGEKPTAPFTLFLVRQAWRANWASGKTMLASASSASESREWLELVKLYWPDCPATVTKNGAFLQVEPGMSVLSRAGRVRTAS